MCYKCAKLSAHNAVPVFSFLLVKPRPNKFGDGRVDLMGKGKGKTQSREREKKRVKSVKKVRSNRSQHRSVISCT